MGRLWRCCKYPAVEHTRVPGLAAQKHAVSVLGPVPAQSAALAGALRGFSGVRVRHRLLRQKKGSKQTGRFFLAVGFSCPLARLDRRLLLFPSLPTPSTRLFHSPGTSPSTVFFFFFPIPSRLGNFVLCARFHLYGLSLLLRIV